MLVAYLIVGALFMKFVKKSGGREIIPNVDVWISAPGLIKVLFILILISGTENSNR